MFPYERLIVYQLAVEFSDFSRSTLIPKIAKRSRSDGNQLDKATGANEFNICEGASAFAPKVKANYYRIARASVGECSGIVRRALRRGYISAEEAERAQNLLNRLSYLLLQLIRRWER